MLNLLAHASKQNYRTLPEVLLAGGDASSFVDITGTGNSMFASEALAFRLHSALKIVGARFQKELLLRRTDFIPECYHTRYPRGLA